MMSANPVLWNVVVAGQWNRAIFSPAWVGKNLFGLAPGEPLQVEISLDEIQSPRVTAHGQLIAVAAGRLIIEPATPNYETLAEAAKLAIVAIDKLSETPLAAAGVNVRYKLDKLPPEAMQQMAVQLDTALADEAFEIRIREMKRVLQFSTGALNLRITSPQEGQTEIEYNFHLDSSSPDALKEWLSKPMDDFKGVVMKISRELMRLDI